MNRIEAKYGRYAMLRPHEAVTLASAVARYAERTPWDVHMDVLMEGTLCLLPALDDVTLKTVTGIFLRCAVSPLCNPDTRYRCSMCVDDYVQIADERRTCRQGRCGLTAASWQRLTILVLVAAECALITPLAMKADISRVRIAALLASLCRDAPPTWRMWLARHLRDWRMFPPDGADSTGTERYINTLIRFVDKAMGGSYQEPHAPF